MNISRREFSRLTAGLMALQVNQIMAAEKSNSHAVLLGDSIFDNGVYVGQAPAVIDQLREALGASWDATLLAVDGDSTADVADQLAGLPESATHLVVSVGGNDALAHTHIMADDVPTVGSAFLRLAKIQEAFTDSYEKMLDKLRRVGLPLAVCTIYDPNFENRLQQQMAATALTAFNDRILRAAFRRGLPVIDLRVLFSKPSHYANPIEPSSVGGQRLASAIADVLKAHPFDESRAVVYGATRD